MYSDEQRKILLDMAEKSIRHGLDTGEPIRPNLNDYDADLQADRATFVTLKRLGELRGCIGALSAYQPLIVDVAQHAFDAAFKDPRFSPLTRAELTGLDIHISVLSPAEPIVFSSEADLLEQIRTGIDGLILEEGYYRGTFLPSVWEQVANREEFLRHLKMKAGLVPSYWSSTVKVSRYTTESFGTIIST